VKNGIGALITKASLYTREPFLFIYVLSIFLTSTAFVDTNAKMGLSQVGKNPTCDSFL